MYTPEETHITCTLEIILLPLGRKAVLPIEESHANSVTPQSLSRVTENLSFMGAKLKKPWTMVFTSLQKRSNFELTVVQSTRTWVLISRCLYSWLLLSFHTMMPMPEIYPEECCLCFVSPAFVPVSWDGIKAKMPDDDKVKSYSEHFDEWAI